MSESYRFYVMEQYDDVVWLYLDEDGLEGRDLVLLSEPAAREVYNHLIPSWSSAKLVREDGLVVESK